MSKNTQCDRIVKYMLDFGSITSLEAFNELGCVRLASRICDLRKKGYRIESKTEIAKNRYGEKVNYKRYSFVKEGCNNV